MKQILTLTWSLMIFFLFGATLSSFAQFSINPSNEKLSTPSQTNGHKNIHVAKGLPALPSNVDIVSGLTAKVGNLAFSSTNSSALVSINPNSGESLRLLKTTDHKNIHLAKGSSGLPPKTKTMHTNGNIAKGLPTKMGALALSSSSTSTPGALGTSPRTAKSIGSPNTTEPAEIPHSSTIPQSVVPAAPTNTPEPVPMYLFVQTANKATLKRDPYNNTRFILILNEVAPNMIYFSNITYHKVGMIPMTHFVEMWNKGKNIFKVQTPSGAFISANFSGDGANGINSNVLQLSIPVYNLALNQLSFVVKPSNPTMQLQEGTWTQSAVVIDSAELGRYCDVCNQK